ncbi:MAG: type II toxin-antitoxin system RelB/DinJ family antitoxin [Actinomycetaceae bacterium]|nr:type II toxin-antitoxin system RelB/DinJ family antitoxin [Arcanobacterium sp.]MDD7687522.1 type II toxin-antitoxin system RelB/DinJ family antitoxin [Actinomycetaceae bacterium]MDY5272996.1 type II toxin-antitoxin system RelB/DinJ family antitoxin [Arcanobacterium sp.]
MKTASVNIRIQEEVKVKAEEILETMGIPRATAIDMFYRQIIMHKGIPFPLTIPDELPARDALSEAGFNSLMSIGHSQALSGDTENADDVFNELEESL